MVAVERPSPKGHPSSFWRSRSGRRLLLSSLSLGLLVAALITAAELALESVAGGEPLQNLPAVLGGHAAGSFLVVLLILLMIHRLIGRPPVGETDRLRAAIDAMADQLDARESEAVTANAWMAAILDNIPDLAWLKDTDGIYLAVNRPLAEVLGYSDPREIVGKTDFDLSPRDIALAYRADDDEVMRNGERKRTGESHVRADGSLFPIETIKGPLRNAEGKIVGTVGIARDVSAQENVEAELRRTAQTLANVIANLPGTVFRIHYPAHGQKRMVSFAGTQPYNNLPDHPISPEDFTKFYHPDDIEWLFVDLPKRLLETDIVVHQFRSKMPDGTFRWRRAWERVVERTADGFFTEGISLDITDEVETKLALETSEREFRTLAENSPDIIIRYDRDCRRTYVNPAWQRLTSIPQAQALAITPRGQWAPTIPPYEEYETKLRAALTTGEPQETVVDWPQEFGHIIHHDVRIVPERDSKGAIAGVLVIGHDVTLLKQAEAKLQDLVDNLPGLTFRVTILPSGMRRMVFTGGSGLDLPPDITGKEHWFSPAEMGPHVHPDDVIRVAHESAEQLERCGSCEIRYRLATPDGRLQWVMSRAKIVRRDDSVTVVEGMLLDVTSEILARQALEAVIANLPGTVFRFRYPVAGPKKLLMLEGAAIGRGRRWEEIAGASDSEFADIFLAEERTFLFEDLPQVLREQGHAEFCHRTREADGGISWWRTWERVVERDGEGFITEGISLDVTAEMEAKKSLELSERHFRDLVEVLPVGVFENDLRTGCVFASTLWSELTGLTQSELLGSGWHRTLVAEEIDRITRAWQEATRNRALFTAEYRLRNLRSDRETWVLARAQPRIDEDGRLLGYIGSITDIGDRKAYEVSLQRLNRVLRTVQSGNEVLMVAEDEQSMFAKVCAVLVETGGYAMAWAGLAQADERKTVRPVASAGDNTGYVQNADIRWDESPLGMGPSGTAVRTGLPQVDDDTASSAGMSPWRDRALACGYRSNVALPLKGSDRVLGCLSIYSGETQGFAEEEVAILLDFASNVAFTVLALRERRRREEIEQQMQQGQKMEALGLLASSIAHDFNNLLGAIKGFAGFILEDATENDKSGYYAQRILMAGARGRALIGQILSFSRQMEIKLERLSLAETLAETESLLKASIPSSSRLVTSVEPGGAWVNGDRSQLSQILINLCVNAHDAMEGRVGSIIISVRPTMVAGEAFQRLAADDGSDPDGGVQVWEDQDGFAQAVLGYLDPSRSCVSMLVSDDGCGMTQETLQKVFTPFFTTKEKGHGTGLGLAAVQRIVNAHHGAILVKSRPGVGTTFEIVLPAASPPEEADASASPAGETKDQGGGRILLVDDDPDFGDMLLTALERRGFEVSPCVDPLEALEGLKDYPGAWDAMVTDQTMPNMSGLDLIRAAKALQPELACILCTGYADDILDEQTLAEAGADSLFRKPVDIQALTKRLERIKRQRD